MKTFKNLSSPDAPKFNIFSWVIVIDGIFIGPFGCHDIAREYAGQNVASYKWSILDTNHLPEPLRSTVLDSVTIHG